MTNQGECCCFPFSHPACPALSRCLLGHKTTNRAMQRVLKSVCRLVNSADSFARLCDNQGGARLPCLISESALLTPANSEFLHQCYSYHQRHLRWCWWYMQDPQALPICQQNQQCNATTSSRRLSKRVQFSCSRKIPPVRPESLTGDRCITFGLPVQK